MAMAFLLLIYQIKDDAQEQFIERSYASMDRSLAHYNDWRSDHLKVIKRIAADPYVLEKTTALLETDLVPDTLMTSDDLHILREYIGPQLLNYGYLGMFIISLEGFNYGSMREDNLTYTNVVKSQMPDVFNDVLDGASVITPPMLSDVPLKYDEVVQSTMFMLTPMWDADGRVMAILSIRLDPYADFSLMFAHNNYGETGESFIVDRRGYFLSHARFLGELVAKNQLKNESQAILTTKGLAFSSAEITRNTYTSTPVMHLQREGGMELDTGSESLRRYINYYGEDVYGFWRWSPEYGVALVSEVSVEELNANQDLVMTIIYGVAAIVSFVLLLVFGSTYSLKMKFFESRTSFGKQLRVREGYLDAMVDAIFVVNQFGIVEYVNKSACDLFNVSSEDILNHHILSILRDSDDYMHLVPELKPLHQVYNDGDDFKEGYFLFDSGSMQKHKKLHYVATAIKRGSRHLGAVLQIRDISVVSNQLDQQRLAEKKNFRLLTEQRELMKAVILEAQKPLVELSSYINLIHSGSNQMPEVLQKYLSSSLRSIGDMTKMSEDLKLITDYFEVDESARQQEVNISILLEDLRKKYREMFEKQSFEFYISDSIKDAPNVRANYDKMSHVLEQIIHRAIKFNLHNGSIMIRGSVIKGGYLKVDILESPKVLSNDENDQNPKEVSIDAHSIDYTMTISMQVLEYIVRAIGGRFGYHSVLGSYNSYWLELPLAINIADDNKPQITSALLYHGAEGDADTNHDHHYDHEDDFRTPHKYSAE